MDCLKFVHCADLHLDSPMEGMRAVSPDIAAVLQEATFRSFQNVIDLAIRERVDFLIIAGDVYDSADRSLRAQLRFRDGLARAAEHGIWTFLVHGNHDPLSGWEAGLRLPDLVVRYGTAVEAKTYRRGGEEVARLYGVSYPVREVRSNLARQFAPEVDRSRRQGTVPFHIGILHCNVAGNPGHDNYAPCSVGDLAEVGLDLWALGHVHNRQVIRPQAPSILYPGNTQGRSVRETGERGCYLVEVGEEGDIRYRFIPTQAVRWFQEEAGIEGLDGFDDLWETLRKKKEEVRSQAAGQPAVLHLVLGGRGSLHPDPDRREELADNLVNRLREEEEGRADFVWVESLEVRTRPAIDLERRREVQDFVGEFLRCAEAMRKDGGARAIRQALAVRSEYRRLRAHVGRLTDRDLLDILAEAEALGLDLLATEGE